MKISFTGSHSSGKSTLLSKCVEHYGDRFIYVHEVTRPAQELGLTINEWGDDRTQAYVLGEHLKNDELQGDVIMDRCFIDGWVYTTWLHSQKCVGDAIQKTYDGLWPRMVQNLDLVFFTEPVKLEHDGVRSMSEVFRDGVQSLFETQIALLEEDENFKGQVVRLKGSVEKRFKDIKVAIGELENA